MVASHGARATVIRRGSGRRFGLEGEAGSRGRVGTVTRGRGLSPGIFQTIGIIEGAMPA
jgi:hypothetical protein